MSKRKTSRPYRKVFSNEYMQSLARKGGRETAKKHGSEHFSAIRKERDGKPTPLQILLDTGQDVRNPEESMPPPEEFGNSDLR